MKLKLSQISRALTQLIESFEQSGLLYDLKICKLKYGDIEAPDKQGFCVSLDAFKKLDEFIKGVLEHDKQRKNKTKDSESKSNS